MCTRLNLIFLLALIDLALAESTVNFLFIGTYQDCEGKHNGNYTQILTEASKVCNENTLGPHSDNLVQTLPDGKTVVNQLQLLAAAKYPLGANQQVEVLYLVTSGPLEGKFIYQKRIHLVHDYLKKCSSILARSVVTTKNVWLLISDKLDPNVLISPTGGFETFKKGCTTICTGNEYFV